MLYAYVANLNMDVGPVFYKTYRKHVLNMSLRTFSSKWLWFH